mgnify:CR=1 FL=1
MRAKHLRPKHIGRKVELVNWDSQKVIIIGKLEKLGKKEKDIERKRNLSHSYKVKDFIIDPRDKICFLD